MKTRLTRRVGAGVVSFAIGLGAAGLYVPVAQAAGSWWHVSSVVAPSNLAPGGKGQVVGIVTNLGAETSAATAKHPITITDTIPAGLTIVPAGAKAFFAKGAAQVRNPLESLACSESGQTVTCTLPEGVAPYGSLEIVTPVTVTAANGATLTNEVKVEGGESGVTPVTGKAPVHISGEATPFGVEQYELAPENPDGTIDTQAGSHPYQLTTTFSLNEGIETNSKTKREEGNAPALVRNLHFVLPPGLLGNVNVVPECSTVDFSTIAPADVNLCPADSAIGVARVMINEPNIFGGVAIETVPVFNLVPAPGEPARFGIELDKVPVTLTTAVRTGSDYAVEVTVRNTSETVAVLATQLTFWGVPDDPSHDAARGWECVDNDRYDRGIGKSCEPLKAQNAKPFLTLPAECSATAPTSTVSGDSWPLNYEAGKEVRQLAPTTYKFPQPLSGCALIGFAPTISVEPDTHAANSPAGLTVGVEVPQTTTLEASGLAEADVAATTVVLPEGVQASPAAADGLLACSGEGVGFNTEGGQVTESLKTIAENDHFTPNEVTCPEASKIGTATIRTPLLKHELTGSVYLASQDTNPFGTPLVIYLIAEDPISGVRVKLAGEVQINQSTGQLTSVFSGTPPVPFEALTLKLFGGARASQSTPAFCGTYTTTSTFLPSTARSSATPSAQFAITEGAGGGACRYAGTPQTFAPALTAGPTSTQAGGFTNFTLTINHSDADQPLNNISVTLPEGLAALLSKVTPCSEPPAEQKEWHCGPESQIGEATTSSGLGSDPFNLTGTVYLTTGYDGAPFGLLVATEAKAGPFNLGWVYVRSRINVNPVTAAVTITTDEGPHKDTFPTRLQGVPVQVKRINVLVNRPEFQFNPTNCSQLAVSGALGGSEGASAPFTTPFQVENCASLPFAPKLTASTGARASKVGGANLDIKIESAGLGQADIQKVDLQLPVVLPSRQSTLEKACPEAVFNANPATCDEGANIGYATIRTPVLKSPLTGPAYLVSHGGAAFPDVEFVLQGEGILLILDGKTDIKKGVTYSRFESSPDAPFTTFETVLPTGPHSALTSYVPGANHYNLCNADLAMPTEITAQDGAHISEITKIAVAGCVPSVKVTGTRYKRGVLLVSVEVSTSAGRLTISGKGLKTAVHNLGIGTHTLKVPLTKAGLALAKHHRKIRVKASLKVAGKSYAASAAARL